MNQSAIDTLLAAATLAPSGDNTQPWKFSVDRSQDSVILDINPARDPSPMNAGQRMAWIAIGAAIENMVQTAQHNGWSYELHDLGDGPTRFHLRAASSAGEIPAVLAARATNRRVYQGGTLSTEMLQELATTVGSESGETCQWLTDPATMRTLSTLIARADALMFGNKTMRDAFLRKVRFDQPATAVVDEGLSLGSLEVPSLEQRLLGQMHRFPDWLLHALGGKQVFAKTARKLADSASGFCLIRSPDDSCSSRVAAGRTWQRAWLALTDRGFAVQPMMSLCVLSNLRKHGPETIIRQIGEAQLSNLFADFSRSLNGGDRLRVVALMRFGTAAAPTVRTGRLDVQRSCT